MSKLLERIQRQSELVVLEISVVLSQESYVLLLQLLDVDRGPAVDFGQVYCFGRQPRQSAPGTIRRMN